MRRLCVKEPTNPHRGVGMLYEVELLKKYVEYVKEKKQNFTVLIVGATGSGKSTLMLHSWDIWTNGAMDLDLLAYDKMTTANVVKKGAEKGKFTFLAFDELDLSSYDALSKFNKKFIWVMKHIRGKQLITFACAPTLNDIDKRFWSESLCDYVAFVYAPQSRFYWISYKQLVAIHEKYGDLKLKTLADVASKYADFDCYFNQYTGEVWEEYSKLKEIGMDDVVEEFYEEFGKGERLSLAKAAKRIGYSVPTVKKYALKGIEEKALPESLRKGSGNWSIPVQYLDELRLYVENNMRVGGVSS